MSRKKARDNAFKCVYELEFGRDENKFLNIATKKTTTKQKKKNILKWY